MAGGELVRASAICALSVNIERLPSGGEGEELEYWLPVSVCSSYIERKVGSHPGVSEVVVKGVAVAGVGTLPRAYVTIKPGFSLPGEELASWCNSRLEWRYRWEGGREGALSI